MATSAASMQKMVDALRQEKAMNRSLVSSASNDLLKFAEEHKNEDVFINGFASDKLNPYRPKSSFQCTAL